MRRVALIHWDPTSMEKRAGILRRAGYVVSPFIPEGASSLKRLGDAPPAAIVVDLSRLPAQGVAVAIALRQRKATRPIPLVFMDGSAEARERARRLLPDVTQTSANGIAAALRRVLIRKPAAPPVVPGTMDGYSGTSLVRKLGIRTGCRLALLRAPRDFERQLVGLPDGVRIDRRGLGRADVGVYFTTRAGVLTSEFPGLAARLSRGARLWIAWPKQTSGVASDVTQALVRERGLATGLVDFKICAIDATWSGLCFTHRAPERPRKP
jgi:CheY-like chemotaxis protein